MLYKAGKIDHLNSLMRIYFMDIYLTISILIDNPSRLFPLSIDVKKYMSLFASSSDLDKLIFQPIDDPYDTVARCIYCEMSTSRGRDLNKKLKNKYALCCNAFHYVFDDEQVNCLTIDNTFMDNYKDINDFMIENVNLNFEKDEIFFKKFKMLNSITLVNNQLDKFPTSILNAKKLRSLNVVGNPIRNFNSSSKNPFKHLKQLEILELNCLPMNCVDLDTNNEFIKLPDSIKKLKLIQLRLNHIPFQLNNCESLNELIFSGIKWIDIESFTSGTTVMLNKEALSKRMNKILTNIELDKLFNYFDLDKNSFLNAEELIKLNGFLFRKFPRLGDNFTTNDINNTENKFIQSYLSIFELKNLTLLDLSYQAITFIPDQIESLVNLEKLMLNDCILLENLSAKIVDLKKLNELKLNSCISLKTPPTEICRRGFSVIISYLKRLSSGSIKCNRTKLMLVGLGDAGKTSLYNSLTRYSSGQNNDERTIPGVTDGIQIKNWTIDLDNDSKLTYSMWDFGTKIIF